MAYYDKLSICADKAKITKSTDSTIKQGEFRGRRIYCSMGCYTYPIVMINSAIIAK